MAKSEEERFGLWVGVGYFLLSCAYVFVLILGLAFLPSPEDPIGEPYFTLLELIILAMCPFIVAFFSMIQVRAMPDRRVYGVSALVFAALLSGVTACVHFAILVLGRQPEFTQLSEFELLLSFRWPSLVYVLDILAWDVFFPLAVLLAVPALPSGPGTRMVRMLFVLSGLLAFAGLAGVAVNDMQLRNIGVIGYAGVFPIAVLLFALQLKQRVDPGGADRELL